MNSRIIQILYNIFLCFTWNCWFLNLASCDWASLNILVYVGMFCQTSASFKRISNYTSIFKFIYKENWTHTHVIFVVSNVKFFPLDLWSDQSLKIVYNILYTLVRFSLLCQETISKLFFFFNVKSCFKASMHVSSWDVYVQLVSVSRTEIWFFRISVCLVVIRFLVFRLIKGRLVFHTCSETMFSRFIYSPLIWDYINTYN